MKQSKIFNAGQIIALQSGQMTMFSELVKKRYANTDVVWKALRNGKQRILVERQNDVPPPVTDLKTGSTTHRLVAFSPIEYPYMVGQDVYVREKAYQAEGALLYAANDNQPASCKIIPAGQMSLAQSRITLHITCRQSLPTQNVDADALQGMGFAGTLGYSPIWYQHHKEDHIKRFGQESWDNNDWIHIFTFEKTEPLVVSE